MSTNNSFGNTYDRNRAKTRLALFTKRAFWLVMLIIIEVVLSHTPAPQVERAAAAGPMMYVTNYGNNKVIRANLDGTGGTDLGNLGGFLSGPVGIGLDVGNGKMYVANLDSSRLTRANLNGTGGTNLANPNGTLSSPRGTALDIVNGKIYFANGSNNTISRANLDGTGGESLGNLNGTLNIPTDIALDLAHGKMYVANGGNSTISRADLDGSNGASLGNLNSTLNGPGGIALDVIHDKMYVTNGNNNTISQATLSGGGGMSLGNLNSTLSSPFGIALDIPNNKMYVANGFNSTISRANLDGSSGTNLGNLSSLLNDPAGIALELAPDLTASIANNVGGSARIGNTFNWTITVQNTGNAPALFADTKVILRDPLPAGPTYGTPVIQNFASLTNALSINCVIAANILTCTANGNYVGIGANIGKFDVVVPVTPNSLGTLTNPTGGACRADPNNAVAESDESNNSCNSSVVTVGNAMLFLPLILR